MGQIVELVFEIETPADAGQLILAMLGEPMQDRDIEVEGQLYRNLASIPELIAAKPEALYVRPSPIVIDEIGVVQKVGIRAVKTAEGFDVELSIDLDEIAELVTLVRALFSFAQRLASVHGAKTFYAGLEPACDLDTRIFTENTLGPFRFPS